jgi:hypothetical protein
MAYGDSRKELREDKGKSEGRRREERVGKTFSEILSRPICPKLTFRSWLG